MKTIFDALSQIETIIYKVLIWLILIPKTLIQVILKPGWAPEYIKKELDEGKSRFDEYFPPVLLLLVIALIPFVFWGFLPDYGIKISSPSIENPTPNRTLDFTAQIDLISTSTEGFVTVFWRVEQEYFDGQTYSYPSIRLTRRTNNPAEISENEYSYFYRVDNNTLQDVYTYTFPVSGGDFWVVAEAYKADPDGNLIEIYTNEVYVYVPANSQENVEISAFNRGTSAGAFNLDNFIKGLQSETTIFLALGLLIPPLLFALASKLFSGQTLSEDLLKETFYVQCYYFSPIAFLFWATRYAVRFATPDVFGFYNAGVLFIFVPLILAVFWFVSVQTYAIARERNIRGWQAFLIVMGCMSLVIAGVMYIVNVSHPAVQEGTRLTSIWLYPLLAIALLTAYHWLFARQRRMENKRTSLRDFGLIAVTVLIVLGIVGLVRLVGRYEYLSRHFDEDRRAQATFSIELLTSIAPATQAAQGEEPESTGAAQATSLPVPTVVIAATAAPVQTIVETPVTGETPPAASLEAPAPQKYYTEEFNGDLASWPYFLTQGDESAVKFNLDGGRLYFQLQQEGGSPRVYLVNNSFSYVDARIEAFVTNNGVNANGVSLICRYSGAGWYEFTVSNSGEYTISAYDAEGRYYYDLAIGGSPAINTGLTTNVYAAICKGSDLTLIINGETITTTFDRRFNFTEGLIGLGVSSPRGLPVNVDFDYIKVSEP